MVCSTAGGSGYVRENKQRKGKTGVREARSLLMVTITVSTKTLNPSMKHYNT